MLEQDDCLRLPIVGLNVTAGIAGLNAAHSFPSVALTFSIDLQQ